MDLEHGKLRIATFVDAVFAENGYLLWCDGRPDAWIVDPGFPPQPEQFSEKISALELKPQAILLTHCHADHISGIEPLRQLGFSEVPIIAPRAEEHLLSDARANLSAEFGLPIVAPPADRLLSPGDQLRLGDMKWDILDVAGHSPGGLALYCAEVGVVLTGDALFAGSIGRYDFHNSSREKLLANIKGNLLSLPDDTVLYSGHGPPSTIGHERLHNEVLRWELGK